MKKLSFEKFVSNKVEISKLSKIQGGVWVNTTWTDDKGGCGKDEQDSNTGCTIFDDHTTVGCMK